jgi:uncharacterized protein
VLFCLSPAKKLSSSEPPEGLDWTTPHLQADVETLAKVARGLSQQRLSKLMKISPKLAELNHDRFQRLGFPFTPDNAAPAIYSFAGDTYVGFDVAQLDLGDLRWARDRVAILSGLYGVLRPLDLIQPYRLEMGTKLATARGGNLYEFWGTRLADRIDELTAGHEDRSIVNLASNEYFKAVRPSALAGPVIDVHFREVREGEARMLMLFAKRARGAMARWAVQRRIERPEQLKGFDEGGYAFQPELSTETSFVFHRPQPAPAR